MLLGSNLLPVSSNKRFRLIVDTTISEEGHALYLQIVRESDRKRDRSTLSCTSHMCNAVYMLYLSLWWWYMMIDGTTTAVVLVLQ